MGDDLMGLSTLGGGASHSQLGGGRGGVDLAQGVEGLAEPGR